MDYRELAQDLLKDAGKLGASGAEVLVVEDESFSVRVRMRSVDTLLNAREKRLGLRLCFGQRSATTATSDLSQASLRRLLDDTGAMAQATAEDPFGGLPEPGAFASSVPDLALWDPEPANLPVPERIGMAEAAESAALDFDPRISNSEGAEYGHGDARIFFANSSGFSGDYRSSSMSLSVSPVAKDNGGMQRDGWYSVARRFKKLEPPETIGRIAAQRTLRRLGAKKVATQQVPVVFDPDMAASLLRNLCSAVSGSTIYRGASFLVGKLGQQVASPELSVVDDGRMQGGLGSKPFDGEGLPTRKKIVIQDGVLASYLLDTYSARKLGLTSTGNASRSLGQKPTVGPTNFFIPPGPHDPDAIIRSVDHGLYVTELIGFGVNLVTGDYSRGAVGIWIEGGELTYPVEEITIAGNLKEMFQQVEMIGSDLEWRGSIAAPTLKIGRMTVAGN
ncbi:MAG TPA: TldD/PmbA family protein [Candidatus Acidoferrum sp.]|nr:TldD/PmbA family protein [Candidatus Acidoferrum sp.]